MARFYKIQETQGFKLKNVFKICAGKKKHRHTSHAAAEFSKKCLEQAKARTSGRLFPKNKAVQICHGRKMSP